MSFFRRAASGYLLNRLLRSQSQRRGYGRGGYGYGRAGYGRGGFGYGQRGYGHRRPTGWYAPRRRGRTGFWGPLPYYSRTTRGGSRVTVTGCCLPLALTMAAVPAIVARAAWRSVR